MRHRPFKKITIEFSIASQLIQGEMTYPYVVGQVTRYYGNEFILNDTAWRFNTETMGSANLREHYGYALKQAANVLDELSQQHYGLYESEDLEGKKNN